MPLLAISALMRVIASAIGTALLTRTMPSSLSAHAAEAAATRRNTSSSGIPKFAKRLVKRRVMERLLLMCQCRLHGFRRRMSVRAGDMKCELALNSIAAGYRHRSIHGGYRTDCATAFQTPGNPASDGPAPDWRASPSIPEETPMITLSKTLIAAAFAAIATSAFSQVPWEFNPGMAYMYSGPGKMMAMAMASAPKNH